MACFHRAFGLVIESPTPIPGLPILAAPEPVDITLTFSDADPPGDPPDGSILIGTHREGPDDRRPVLHAWRGPGMDRYFLQYAEGCAFDLEAGGARVQAAWRKGLTLEDAAVYLLGPVLGWIQRLRGRLCLHASCFVHGGAAVALLAPAGAGKSSLAALFHNRGHEVLADDVTALTPGDGPPSVFPACPRIGLWPSSVALLFGEARALPRITPTHPTWDKCFLAIPEARFVSGKPVPLKAIYAAFPKAGEHALRIHSAEGAAALRVLAANAYVTYLMDPAMRARDLDAMAALVRAVPVRLLVAGDRDDHPLEAVAERILGDLSGI